MGGDGVKHWMKAAFLNHVHKAMSEAGRVFTVEAKREKKLQRANGVDTEAGRLEAALLNQPSSDTSER